MSRIRERILAAATIVLCVLLFLVKQTGGVWHAVFGIMLVTVNVGHTCKHFVKLRYQKKKVRVTAKLLLGALIVMFATGMLIHPTGGSFAVKLLHKLAAVVFVLGSVGHAVQHAAIRREREGRKNDVSQTTSEGI